ncbi:hypothetical protein NOVA_6 [Mycobacterium phage Nova]|uniref:VIP2-like toxin n=1 Tax=Mycobacterium phage Nova TaxID=1089130 RepID=G8IAL5_9CAUD|nr:hypothetical protein NOVA_6 [Mycobacterium phage Nova]
MPKKKVTGAKLKWGSAAQKRAQQKAAEASARKRRKRGLQDILKRKRRAAGSFSEVRKSSVKVAREHDLSGTGHGANKEAYRASAAESRKIKAAGGTSSADRVYSTARKLKYTAPRGKAGNQGKVGLSQRSKGSGSSSDKFKQGDTVYADGKSWTIRSFREADGNTYVDAKADNGTDLSLVIKGTGLDKKTIRTALGDRSRSESKTVKPGDSAAAHRAKSFSQNARGVSMGGRGSSSGAPKDMSSMSDRDLQNAILNARTAADKKAYSNELAKRNLDKHFPKGIKNASTEELQNKAKDGTTPSSVKTAIDAEMDRRAKAGGVADLGKAREKRAARTALQRDQDSLAGKGYIGDTKLSRRKAKTKDPQDDVSKPVSGKANSGNLTKAEEEERAELIRKEARGELSGVQMDRLNELERKSRGDAKAKAPAKAAPKGRTNNASVFSKMGDKELNDAIADHEKMLRDLRVNPSSSREGGQIRMSLKAVQENLEDLKAEKAKRTGGGSARKQKSAPGAGFLRSKDYNSSFNASKGYPEANHRAAWNSMVGRYTYRAYSDMTPRQRENERKNLQKKLDNPRVSDGVKEQTRDQMALLDALDKESSGGSSRDAKAQRVLDLHDHELQDLASEMGRLDLYKRDLKGEGHFDRKPSEISKEERVRNAIQGLMRYVEEDLGYEVDWDEQRLDNALNNDPRMKKLRAILAKLGK